MALTIARSDMFPVGTTVAAYAYRPGWQWGSKPSGQVLETQTVAANGRLTFPGIAVGTQVVLWALVAGVHQTLASAVNAAPTPVRTLRDRRTELRRLSGIAA